MLLSNENLEHFLNENLKTPIDKNKFNKNTYLTFGFDINDSDEEIVYLDLVYDNDNSLPACEAVNLYEGGRDDESLKKAFLLMLALSEQYGIELYSDIHFSRNENVKWVSLDDTYCISIWYSPELHSSELDQLSIKAERKACDGSMGPGCSIVFDEPYFTGDLTPCLIHDTFCDIKDDLNIYHKTLEYDVSILNEILSCNLFTIYLPDKSLDISLNDLMNHCSLPRDRKIFGFDFNDLKSGLIDKSSLDVFNHGKLKNNASVPEDTGMFVSQDALFEILDAYDRYIEFYNNSGGFSESNPVKTIRKFIENEDYQYWSRCNALEESKKTVSLNDILKDIYGESLNNKKSNAVNKRTHHVNDELTL